MNVDPIARAYRWLEYAAFGRKLERARFSFLHECGGARRALLLGDGDGRFLSALLSTNREVLVVSVEKSEAMVGLARDNLKRGRVHDQSRVSWERADALEHSPSGTYDLIVTNFFFDCFRESEVDELVRRLRPWCAPGAIWIVCDFHQPPSSWRRWHATVWISTMYLFFRVTTGLRVSRIPDYGSALRENGFERQDRRSAMAGLIESDLWRLPETSQNLQSESRL